MTTLSLGVVGSVLTLAFAAITVTAGHASVVQAQAEAAADAAALAAVAESGPYGSGSPEAEAQRFARLNNATVVSCTCAPGSLSATVSVEHDGARATSRADFNPAAIAPADAPGTGGLNPRLAAAVTRLLGAGRGAITLVSGYRSKAHQAALWRGALARYGSPEAADDWVAPPGSSMHERGLAVDLGGDLDLAQGLIERLHLPMWRPLPNEPWHFELVGSR